jgi:hypothetical protein
MRSAFLPDVLFSVEMEAVVSYESASNGPVYKALSPK